MREIDRELDYELEFKRKILLHAVLISKQTSMGNKLLSIILDKYNLFYLLGELFIILFWPEPWN